LPTGAADEGRVSPPPGFDVGIVLPPAWGVSLRALTDDLILPPGLSIGGPATRTRRSDWIAGICCIVPIKNTGPIHIDLIEDLDSGSESIARRGPRTRGGAATGGTTRKGPKTRGGGIAARGGTAARGGGAATVQGRGGGNVSSSNQVKGKRIVTCIEKVIEIMESKMKRKERDWKP
jgi:hypothetical protein